LGFQHARGHFLVIGLVARMHVGSHDGARVQIDHRLGLVNHVGGSVLGPADFGVRIVRVPPFLIAAFTRAIPVELAHRRGVIGIDSILGSQPLHILPILLLGIAMDQRAQGSVGLDDRGIDSQVLAAQKPMLTQGLQRQRENLLINFQPQALANDGEGGMIGRFSSSE